VRYAFFSLLIIFSISAYAKDMVVLNTAIEKQFNDSWKDHWDITANVRQDSDEKKKFEFEHQIESVELKDLSGSEWLSTRMSEAGVNVLMGSDDDMMLVIIHAGDENLTCHTQFVNGAFTSIFNCSKN